MAPFGECFSANQKAGFQSHGGVPYFILYTYKRKTDKISSATAKKHNTFQITFNLM